MRGRLTTLDSTNQSSQIDSSMNYNRLLFTSLLGGSLLATELIACSGISEVATSQASKQTKPAPNVCSSFTILPVMERIASRTAGPVGVAVGLVEGGEVVG